MAQDPQSAITVQIDERSGVERSLKKFKRMCESFLIFNGVESGEEHCNEHNAIRAKAKVPNNNLIAFPFLFIVI